MIAVVTGASSGIGQDIAKELANAGYELVLVARSGEKLEQLCLALPVKCQVIEMDLSQKENCFALYNQLQGKDVEILINNAGFGLFGSFFQTALEEELNMIDLNVEAVHILTKLFLRDFIKKDRGYILNVASSAAFLAGGPLMSTYYATKAYVLHLSEAVYEELRRKKSRVSISVLCPGPVATNFSERASVHFTMPALSSRHVAQYAVKKMFQKKLVIVPGASMKFSHGFVKCLPDKAALKIAYHIQHKKRKP